MTGEDRLRLRALSEALGIPQSRVMALALADLWARHERGELRGAPTRIPIRVAHNRVVWVEVEP